MKNGVLGLGLIGSGFMGKTHAIAFASAQRIFDLPFEVDFNTIAEVDAATADCARKALGFRNGSSDWHRLLDDPDIDIIDITTPNTLHHEMAMAAIAAGKHVYCEKPLAPRAAQARDMMTAAEAAGVVTQVGFNYLKNPLFAVARDMIASGGLGEIRNYRGVHVEDYMADATQPMTWRHDPTSGGGALADLGSHVFATARYLLGPISSVQGRCMTVIPRRPMVPGSGDTVVVETDDMAQAFITFENGVVGSIEVNWAATGRKMQHDFEIYGSRGALIFTQERLNELRLYKSCDVPAERGFRIIATGPQHSPYGSFSPAPGHQLGFNDLKAIEVRDFVCAIAGEPVTGPAFREGYEVQRLGRVDEFMKC